MSNSYTISPHHISDGRRTGPINTRTFPDWAEYDGSPLEEIGEVVAGTRRWNRTMAIKQEIGRRWYEEYLEKEERILKREY